MVEDIDTFYGLNCTINTTEDCNLRCKYCYEINKKNRSIDFEYCKKFIDLVLQDTDFCKTSEMISENNEALYFSRIFDFIGGDSLMDVKLLERVLRYINIKCASLDKKLFFGWRCSLSSNGTLFGKKEVRDFCEKWKDNLYIGISIDGCPTIHDMNRVFPDGSGSMSKILEWWPWYQKTFPLASLTTKATCSKNTIPYLYESLKFMHETLGIRWIHQNFIMEDTGCTEEDYKLLDEQLELCCDYCIEHKDDLYWSMIGPTFDVNSASFKERDDSYYTEGECGSGIMPALSIDGDIYPCFRWLPHTQKTDKVMCVGNVFEGFTHAENFVKVKNGAVRSNCTKEQKCKDCKYESACHYCIGGCYCEFGDFIRTTYICEITKLQCKWATIYGQKVKSVDRHSILRTNIPLLKEYVDFDYKDLGFIPEKTKLIYQLIGSLIVNNDCALDYNYYSDDVDNLDYKSMIYKAMKDHAKGTFLYEEYYKNTGEEVCLKKLRPVHLI